MKKNAKILIACEESGVVCKAFRDRGFTNVFSCDLLPTSGGHPEWHIQGDVLEQLDKGWDMMIAHPPCTYLSNAGATWLFPNKQLNEERYKNGLEAKDFFMAILNADIQKIAVENPIQSKIFNIPKYNQIIQPYQFGHPYSKKTCLWLKGLEPLKPTRILNEYTQFVSSGSACRKGIKAKDMVMGSKERSKTFQGIADAMAEQWG